MIDRLRDLEERLARLEAVQQRPSQEIRDAGALRVSLGRHAGDVWTVRAHSVGGAVLADLLGLGPVVTSLPASPTPGQIVRFRPGGSASITWLCMWEPWRNSGTGAWAVLGGQPLRAVQSTAQTITTANVVTVQLLTGAQVGLPVGGVWEISAHGDTQMQAAAVSDAVVWLAVGGVLSQGMATLSSAAGAPDGSDHGVTTRITAASAATLSLRAGTNAQPVAFGGRVLWALSAMPLELRP